MAGSWSGAELDPSPLPRAAPGTCLAVSAAQCPGPEGLGLLSQGASLTLDFTIWGQ